jgi:hypothetical protein
MALPRRVTIQSAVNDLGSFSDSLYDSGSFALDPASNAQSLHQQ